MSNQPEPARHSEIRWAIVAKIHGKRHFLGRFCWPIEYHHVMPLAAGAPLFSTREEARMYQRLLESYRDCARVVKVRVRIEEVKKP